MNTPMNTWQNTKPIKGKSIVKQNFSTIFTKKCTTTSLYPVGIDGDKKNTGTKIIDKVVSKSYACYICSKCFPSQSEVIMHLKFIHNACATRDCSRIADVRLHSPVCQNRPYDCSVCYKKFSEKYLLQMHFNQHIDAAFHICDVCRDGFQMRKDLQRHMLEIHGKNVTIPVTPSCTKRVYQKCKFCCKYFQLFSEYEDHSFACNTQKLVCGVCKVGFSNLLDLERHEFVEHREKSAVKGFSALKEGKRYFCGLCYLGFSKGDILREHLKTHETNEISDDYTCDECQSTFATDEELQNHYLNHIEEHYILQDVIRQHLCSICKMTFKTQKELVDHTDKGVCKETVENIETQIKTLSNLNEDKLLNDKSNPDLSISSMNTPENFLESDVFGSKPSDFPVYALKAGDELLNCDDSNCVIVIDRDSLFVLQRGVCASECRMPDVSNAEAYNDTDVIDASLLQNHMFNILNVKEDIETADETILGSEISNEALSILEQKLNVDSDSSEILTINLSELNAQLANDPAFKNHQIYIESIPMNDRENSEVSHTYKIVVDDTLEGNETILHVNDIKQEKVPFVDELVKEAV